MDYNRIYTQSLCDNMTLDLKFQHIFINGKNWQADRCKNIHISKNCFCYYKFYDEIIVRWENFYEQFVPCQVSYCCRSYNLLIKINMPLKFVVISLFFAPHIVLFIGKCFHFNPEPILSKGDGKVLMEIRQTMKRQVLQYNTHEIVPFKRAT